MSNVLVTFDFDGTLGDTYPLFREAFDDAARVLGTTFYRREEEAHIRTLEAMDVLRFHGIPADSVTAFVDLVRRGMDARRRQAALFPGISELLEQLSKTEHSLGLISSNSKQLVEAALGRHFALFGYRLFNVSLKAKGAVLRQAGSSESSKPALCYLGDEIRDAHAAQAAGIPFAGVLWGYNTEASLRQAGCATILRCPADIWSFVLDLQDKTRT
jgi:phosphoglycolate phosphatase